MLTLFPVVVLAALQSLGALLLLAPLPVAQVGISLCKQLRTPVGKTLLAAVSVFLLVLLVPPVLEVQSLRQQAKWQMQIGKEYSELEALHRRDAEALAALSAVLTLFCLLMNFVLQKLGWVMSERELAKLKEATLLKQVKGLHAEYDRLSASQAGGGSSPGKAAAAQLSAELQNAREALEAAQAKQKEAEKRRNAAELNLDALKTQTKGLESEYDRLLESHSRLERRLAQHEPGSGQQQQRPGSKKDW